MESPDHPKNYPHNLECGYLVKRTNEDVCALKLTIEHFLLEDGNCIFDYVEVMNERLCGKIEPGKNSK